jgi:NAD(P)-dependent dehydrogenase (short-subunit alcohol dehydrogenase family)
VDLGCACQVALSTGRGVTPNFNKNVLGELGSHHQVHARCVCVLFAGVTGYPGMCAYAASKHALVGMMRCAAAEYGPLGLRVNCINPGAVGEHFT